MMIQRIFSINEEAYKKLRVHLVQQGIPVSKLIRELIYEYMRKNGMNPEE